MLNNEKHPEACDLGICIVNLLSISHISDKLALFLGWNYSSSTCKVIKGRENFTKQICFNEMIKFVSNIYSTVYLWLYSDSHILCISTTELNLMNTWLQFESQSVIESGQSGTHTCINDNGCCIGRHVSNQFVKSAIAME